MLKPLEGGCQIGNWYASSEAFVRVRRDEMSKVGPKSWKSKNTGAFKRRNQNGASSREGSEANICHSQSTTRHAKGAVRIAPSHPKNSCIYEL